MKKLFLGLSVILLLVSMTACSKEEPRGISASYINSSGELVIVYTDGVQTNLGKVVGEDGTDGKDGSNGQDGKDGVNGKDGQDGKIGPQGEKGETGDKGVDGTNGQDGVNGITTIIFSEHIGFTSAREVRTNWNSLTADQKKVGLKITNAILLGASGNAYLADAEAYVKSNGQFSVGSIVFTEGKTRSEDGTSWYTLRYAGEPILVSGTLKINEQGYIVFELSSFQLLSNYLFNADI